MFKPILTERDLPPVLEARETFLLDFKRQGNPEERLEMAKDVAAFANNLGGVILVGATEDRKNGRLGRYQPLPESDSARLARAYDEAIRDRCFPKPFHQTLALPKDGGFVVAVNVWPYPGQPVGVGHDGGGNATAFAFPIRSGVNTVYLSPEQLPMFMDAKARRIAILLGSIPPEKKRNLRLRARAAHPTSSPTREARLEWRDLHDVVRENTVRFVDQRSEVHFSIPLDAISHVWQLDSHGNWTIAVSCLLSEEGESLVVTPE